jgi:hypothetical protein
MSLIRHEGQIELICDAGDEAWPETHAAEDFEILLADAKAAGWRASRIEGEWRHRCPSCIASGRIIQTRPDPKAGLFGPALPIKRKPR